MLFFERYEKDAPWSTNLTWSQYKALSAIENSTERAFYETQAEALGWKKRDLLQAIRADAYLVTGKASDVWKGKHKKLKRSQEATYVYKALVERVIDGDTLLLRMDLGFDVHKIQRLRLEGVDTPDVKTVKGRRAFHFVRAALATVDFVMVKTNKVDVHGRYVGHVFYAKDESVKERVFKQGRYLNQELLNRGLARRI